MAIRDQNEEPPGDAKFLRASLDNPLSRTYYKVMIGDDSHGDYQCRRKSGCTIGRTVRPCRCRAAFSGGNMLFLRPVVIAAVV